VHVIQPTGFTFSPRTLRRSALDYLADAEILEHTSYAAFAEWRHAAGRRLVLLTTKASESAYAARYGTDDILMVGRESAGVPDAVAADAELRVRIPMRAGLRSLNVAVAATLIVGEAKRQTDQFAGLA
jgi:tRNA (cytidine/uridine-2'-O-)-methyltransferase